MVLFDISEESLVNTLKQCPEIIKQVVTYIDEPTWQEWSAAREIYFTSLQGKTLREVTEMSDCDIEPAETYEQKYSNSTERTTLTLKQETVTHDDNVDVRQQVERNDANEKSIPSTKDKNDEYDTAAMEYTGSHFKRNDCPVNKKVGLKKFEDFFCHHCVRKFVCKINIARHVFRSHGEVMDRCPSCKAILAQFSQDEIVNGRPFYCEICNMNFANVSILRNHVISHSRPYHCDICQRSFGRKNTLIHHKAVMHRDNGADDEAILKFKCPINGCNSSFPTKARFQRHQLVHNGIKGWQCDTCGKLFSQKCHLENHKTIHFRAGKLIVSHNFPCHLCERRFPTANRLARHVVIHSGIKPYQCEACKKGFSQKGHLNLHRKTACRVILENVPHEYKCKECSKHFKTEYCLRRHQACHSQEFQCQYCSDLFKTKGSVRNHLQQQHSLQVNLQDEIQNLVSIGLEDGIVVENAK